MDKASFVEKVISFAADVGAQVTDQQIDALWELFGREAQHVWDEALNGLRIGNRWPGRQAFVAAVETARKSGSKRRGDAKAKIICECGGELAQPTGGPFGIQVPDMPLDFQTEEEGAHHRHKHPERWGVYMIRCCLDCGARYYLATEKRYVRRRDGSAVSVEPGQLLAERGAPVFAANSAQAGQVEPSRREYAEFRLQLLQRITDDHLSPDAVAGILTEAMEFFQPESSMIAAEVETLRGRDRWADVPAVSVR